ncbi:MAG: SLC13 family permease, partial [Guyparkeria sp.]
IQTLGERVGSFTGESDRRTLLATIGVAGPSAGFVNNTPVVAIMVPMVRTLARRANTSPSKFLLPLSFASMLGGTLTLIGTSSNLLASDVYADLGGQPFGMFEFTALGVVVLVVGSLYLFTVGWYLTPARLPAEGDVLEEFGVAEYLTDVVVLEASPLLGRTIREVRRDDDVDFDVFELAREGRSITRRIGRERIRPGDKLTLILDEEQFAGLKYDLDTDSELNVFRDDGDNLVAEINDLASEASTIAAGVEVKGSLYQSAIAAGVPPAQVLKLAEVFGWKMDFVRDVRNGDRFKLIYEVRERDGEQLGNGTLLAAEYRSGDRTIQAVRYTSPDGTVGYYEPDGSSLERGFLRYPVEYSRISSNFNPERLHPIHNTVRPHNGVDLAAPTGTPVKSAASGRVTFVGWKHGYGRVAQVRHDEKYDTLYAHLSGFKGNLKRGATVEKGDTIGYVGMTGDATGPHLHYELRVNGKPYDPVKVELPEANPIPSEHRDDFVAETGVTIEQLARVQIDSSTQPTRLARNESASTD